MLIWGEGIFKLSQFEKKSVGKEYINIHNPINVLVMALLGELCTAILSSDVFIM